MSERLSSQISAFRKRWAITCGLGVTLRPEAIAMMDALFASFQGQARLLEMGPHPLTLGDVAEQARLCDEEVREVEAFVAVLRARRASPAPAPATNVVPLRRRAPAPARFPDEGGAA